jgi:hypothetical protein
MHGGTNPGAPKGKRNGAYRHGRWTQAAIAERRAIRDILKQSRNMLREPSL